MADVSIKGTGRLTRNPRRIENNKSMVVSAIALNLPLTVKSGNDKSHIELFELVAFGEQAEKLNQLKSGNLITVDGKLNANLWTDKNLNNHKDLQIKAKTIVPQGKASFNLIEV